MRIRADDTAMRAVHAMEAWSARSESAARGLAGGRRTEHASSDSAASTLEMKLRARSASLSMTVRNLQNTVAIYDVIDAAQQGIVEVASRMESLAVRAANTGTMGTEERDALRAEFEHLKIAVGDIADSTRWGTESLSAASGYKGASSRVQMSEHAGDTWDPVAAAFVSDLAGAFRSITSQVDDAGALTEIQNARAAFESDVRSVYTSARARVGAALSSAQARLATVSDAHDRIDGADMAQLVLERGRAAVMLSAGVAVTAQASGLSRSVVRLLT